MNTQYATASAPAHIAGAMCEHVRIVMAFVCITRAMWLPGQPEDVRTPPVFSRPNPKRVCQRSCCTPLRFKVGERKRLTLRCCVAVCRSVQLLVALPRPGAVSPRKGSAIQSSPMSSPPPRPPLLNHPMHGIHAPQWSDGSCAGEFRCAPVPLH